jgi:CheY-like chemotaxis protein
VSRLLLVIDDDPVERTVLERVLVGAGSPIREGVAPAHG